MVWDVQWYVDCINLKNTGIGKDDQEEALSQMFKPIENAPNLKVMPCTITDWHHWLLLWYLPNILRPEHQVNEALFQCLEMLTTTPAINVHWSSPDRSHIENKS